MNDKSLITIVEESLEEIKAENIQVIDVRNMASYTDRIVIANGRSSQHVKSIATNIASKAKEHNFKVLGIEGEVLSEWVLVDLGDVVAHIMLPETRLFYALEKLWAVEQREVAVY